jgi:hypothetical protein
MAPIEKRSEEDEDMREARGLWRKPSAANRRPHRRRKITPKRTLPPPQGDQAPVREPRLGRVRTHLAKRRTEGGGERPRLGRLDLDLQCRKTA